MFGSTTFFVQPDILTVTKRHGLFLLAVGDTIVLASPLIIEPEQVNELFARFERSLNSTHTISTKF